MKKRIGVTGGTGFIGRYLIRDYADQYDFVVATSQAVPKLPVPGVEYRFSDYSEESFQKAFCGCDAVLHLGAKIPESVTSVGSMRDYMESISSTEALLCAMRHEQINQIVFLSSVSVYDKQRPSPLREAYPYEPDNSYGIAKASIEMMLQLYEKQFGIHAASLRVSQVLGYKEYRQKGFFAVLQEAAREHREIPIYGTGKAARDYIYVKDVAHALSCILEHGTISGIYNIGSGKPTTNLELAEAFCEAFASPAGIVHVPTDREDTRFWYMDISKAREEFGFSPRYDLDSMVRDIRKELERQEKPS